MSNDISRAADKVKGAASDAADAIKDAVGDQASDTLRQAAKDAKSSSFAKAASQAADQGAEKLDEARKYFAGKDGRVLADLESFIHDRPVTSSVIAFVGGVLLTKLLSPSKRDS